MDMRKKQKRWGDEDLSLFLHNQGWFHILMWLPIVSLLRFKAVCTSWRDLIQSPFFIHLHNTTSTTTSSSQFGPFILYVIYDSFCPPPNSSSSSSNHEIKVKHTLLMLSSQSDDSESESSSGGGGSNDEVVVVVDDLGFDMCMKRIAGSCNGLVCLCDLNLGSKPDQIYLWNPATRQCMILPESKTNPRATYNILFGLGYDVETKDYKVVQFAGLRSRWNGNGPEFCFCEVQVYSLSTHSWRRLEGIPCLPGYPFEMDDCSVLYLNGTCFIMAQFFHTKRRPVVPENNRFIISFDFTKEILTPIQLPDHHRDQDLCLCSWGGDKIALFTSPNPVIFKDYEAPIGYWEDFNMWVLNYERGSTVNKKSWTKLHSFQIQIKSHLEWYEPKGISNDGKFALLQQSGYGYKMNLYNFATKEVKRDFLFCTTLMSKAHAFKPSLVSFIGGNGAGRSSSSR